MINRKKYNKEFKLNAIKLFESSDKKMYQIENDLGIGNGCLHRWIKDYNEKEETCFPGNGKQLGKDLEISQLREENRILREEREILKKVVGIFS